MNLAEQEPVMRMTAEQGPQPLKLYQECYAVNVTPGMQAPTLPAICGGLTVALILAVLYGLRRRKQLNDSLARERRAKRSGPADWRDGDTAWAVHQYANTGFYRHQLAVLENLLNEKGYALTRNAYESLRLQPEDRDHIARELEDCRLRVMSPFEDEDSRIRRTEQAVRDGAAHTWLRLLLEGAAQNGWYITDDRPDWRVSQRDPGGAVPSEVNVADAESLAMMAGVNERWFRHAWPLWQVTMVLEGPPGSLTTLIPDLIQQTALQRKSYADGSAGDAGAVKWQLFSCVTPDGKSFFEDGAGYHVSDKAFERQFGESGPLAMFPYREGTERVCILIQGTRGSSDAGKEFFRDEVARALRDGKTGGCVHDDDNGWAFRTIVSPS